MSESTFKIATILLVDDEPQWTELLEQMFPQYAIIGVRSGGEGIELLEKPNEVDLVILDYKMQGMDGIETLERIRKINPDLGVIMFTAFGSKDVVVKALEEHADDFVDKPFNVSEMRQKIEKVLERSYEKRKESGRYEGAIQRVVRFVERNYEKPLTLEDAAAVASLSPKYLSRLFKETTQKSFTQFKTSIRVSKAKELLESTDLHIQEIASKLGFDTPEAFDKVFKKAEGVTPTEYRSRQT